MYTTYAIQRHLSSTAITAKRSKAQDLPLPFPPSFLPLTFPTVPRSFPMIYTLTHPLPFYPSWTPPTNPPILTPSMKAFPERKGFHTTCPSILPTLSSLFFLGSSLLPLSWYVPILPSLSSYVCMSLRRISCISWFSYIPIWTTSTIVNHHF